MAEWDRIPLPEVLDFREGPGILAKDFHETGVPLIRLAGVKAGAHILAGCNYLRAEKVEAKWKQFRLERGDVLLSTSASLGEVAVVPADGVGAIPYTGLIRFRPADDRVDPRFVRIALTTRSFRNQIEAMGVGSVMKHFGPMHLRQMFVEVPPRSVQRAIAEIADALDDKIAANTKLASIADVYLSAQFEHALRDGGTETSLREVAEVNPEKRSPTNGMLRYIDIASVGVGSFSFPEEMPWADAPGRARRGVRSGDIIWSTVRPNRRSHALILDADPTLVASTGLAVIRSFEWPWVYEAMRRSEFTAYLETVAEGSAYPAVRADRFLDARLPFADSESRVKFNGIASAVRSATALKLVENRRLAATRDALLPALMSGRLTVRDAESAVEEAVSAAVEPDGEADGKLW